MKWIALPFRILGFVLSVALSILAALVGVALVLSAPGPQGPRYPA